MAGPLGTLLAVLGIDARQVDMGIDAAERAVTGFSQLKPEVALHVDDAGVSADVGNAQRLVGSFDQMDASAALTVDEGSVMADVGSAARAVDAFDQETATATISIDDSTLMADLRAVDAELRRVAGQKKQLIRLGIDSGPLIDELNVAEHKIRESARKMGGALDDVGPHVQKAGGFFTRFGDIGKGAVMGIGLAIGSMATNFVAALPTLAISKFGDAIALASDKAEAGSKAQVIFGDSFRIIDERSKTAAESVGLSSGAYLAAAGDLGNLTTNLGFAGDEAANMSADMIALAADIGSFNNASPEEVVLAMGAAFRGESEPIRRFGVNLSEAAVQEKAVRLGLVESTKAFAGLDFATKNHIKAQATYALILDQTSKAQGDFERTSSGLANGQRIAAAKMEEAWTRIGETLAPIAAEIVPALADAVAAGIDAIGGLVNGAKNLVDAIQPVVKPFMDLIGTLTGGKGLGDVARTAAGGVVALGAALFALKITGLLGPVKSLAGAILGLGKNSGAAAIQIEAAGTASQGLGGKLKALGSAAATGAAIAGLSLIVEDAISSFGEGQSQAEAYGESLITAGQKAAEGGKDFDALGMGADHAFDVLEENQGSLIGTLFELAGEYQKLPGVVEKSINDTIQAGNLSALSEHVRSEREENNAALEELFADGPAIAEQAATETAVTWNSAFEQQYVQGNEDLIEAGHVQRMLDGMAKAKLQPFFDLGAAVPGEIGEGMQSQANQLATATQGLRDLLEKGLTPKDVAMEALGKNYVNLLNRGMNSEVIGAKETAQSVALAAINAIEDAGLGTTGKGLERIGEIYVELLASGMTQEEARAALEGAQVGKAVIDGLEGKFPALTATGKSAAGEVVDGVQSKYPAFVNAGETAAGKVQTGISSNPWATWGRNVAGEWVDGFVRKISNSADRIQDAIVRGAGGVIAFSPPKVGPLKDIRRFGDSIAGEWINSLASGIAGGAGKVNGAIGAIANRARGLTLATARVAELGVTAPGLAVASAAVGGVSGGVTVNVYGNVYGGRPGLRQLGEDIAREVRFSLRTDRLTG